jgi:hypothetical protein
MAKNDKLKEKLAESRHDDVKLLMYGTFGFAGIALTIAFEAWLCGTSVFLASVAWQKMLYLLPFPLAVASLILVALSRVSRKQQERKKLIEQLGNLR